MQRRSCLYRRFPLPRYPEREIGNEPEVTRFQAHYVLCDEPEYRIEIIEHVFRFHDFVDAQGRLELTRDSNGDLPGIPVLRHRVIFKVLLDEIKLSGA